MVRSKSLRQRALRVALVGALAGGAFGVTAVVLPALGDSGEAHAAVSILMTMDELVAHSKRVVVAQPVERTSRWETLAGGRRIVTYTRLTVEETISGEARPELWVRTLGGTVDKIGQHVSGEAAFTLGERSMVFVEEVEGVAVVTGMAQGHYRLKEAEGKVVLRPSPDAGTLLPRRGPSIAAREVLVDAPLDRARVAVVDAWKRRGPGK